MIPDNRERRKEDPSLPNSTTPQQGNAGAFPAGCPTVTFRPSLGNRITGIVITLGSLTAALGILGFVLWDLFTRPEQRNLLGPGFSWFLVCVVTFVGAMILLFGVNVGRR